MHFHQVLLLKEFERYFPTTKDPRNGREWIGEAFVNNQDGSSMSMHEYQMLEIANDGSLKATFETTTLPVFLINVMVEYPMIAIIFIGTLLPFPTSFLYDTRFSAVTATKKSSEVNLA